MDRDILLACRDASLGYEHRALLEHLTFTVRAGDYLCVVGENGSGKVDADEKPARAASSARRHDRLPPRSARAPSATFRSRRARSAIFPLR